MAWPGSGHPVQTPRANADIRGEKITLGDAAPVKDVSIDLVQGVCWGNETDAENKKMEEILSCGRY